MQTYNLTTAGTFGLLAVRALRDGDAGGAGDLARQARAACAAAVAASGSTISARCADDIAYAAGRGLVNAAEHGLHRMLIALDDVRASHWEQEVDALGALISLRVRIETDLHDRHGEHQCTMCQFHLLDGNGEECDGGAATSLLGWIRDGYITDAVSIRPVRREIVTARATAVR